MSTLDTKEWDLIQKDERDPSAITVRDSAPKEVWRHKETGEIKVIH